VAAFLGENTQTSPQKSKPISGWFGFFEKFGNFSPKKKHWLSPI